MFVALCAALGCESTAPSPVESSPGAVADPYAACRAYLGGTWAVGDYRIAYDAESGGALVTGPDLGAGRTQVIVAPITACTPEAATLFAAGQKVHLAFLPPDAVRASATGYGPYTATRQTR